MTSTPPGAMLHTCGETTRSGPRLGKSGPRLPCRTIDVHCHIMVPEVQDIVAGSAGLALEMANIRASIGEASLAVNMAQVTELAPKLISLEERLVEMDAMGVDVQLISISPTQYFYTVDDRDMAAKLADVVNDRIAETCAAEPDRILGLGTVSFQYPDLAASQLEHLVRNLGLRGVEISSHVGGVNISDRRFDPFWAKADELGIIVFLHPWGTNVGERLSRHYLGNTVGQPMETAIALSNLIFEGTLDRHPGVKLIAAHGGGYLPLYINRSDHAYAARQDAHGCACPPSSYLKKIWFDSLVYEPEHLRRLVDVVGASRIVLGTDYPYDMGHYDPHALLGGFAPEVRDAIAGGNVARLLGLDPGA